MPPFLLPAGRSMHSNGGYYASSQTDRTANAYEGYMTSHGQAEIEVKKKKPLRFAPKPPAGGMKSSSRRKSAAPGGIDRKLEQARVDVDRMMQEREHLMSRQGHPGTGNNANSSGLFVPGGSGGCAQHAGPGGAGDSGGAPGNKEAELALNLQKAESIIAQLYQRNLELESRSAAGGYGHSMAGGNELQSTRAGTLPRRPNTSGGGAALAQQQAAGGGGGGPVLDEAFAHMLAQKEQLAQALQGRVSELDQRNTALRHQCQRLAHTERRAHASAHENGALKARHSALRADNLRLLGLHTARLKAEPRVDRRAKEVIDALGRQLRAQEEEAREEREAEQAKLYQGEQAQCGW
jgi:hypothetical protein